MDPATIIGTTSAILSFVKFTGQIISTAVEIHASLDGASTDNLSLERTVAKFKKIFDKVKSEISLTSSPPIAGTLTSNEFARDSLVQTLTKCQSLGDRITILLKKTKAMPTSQSTGILHYFKKWRHMLRNSPQTRQAQSGPLKPTLVEVIRATIRTVWHKKELQDLRDEWEDCLIQLKVDFSNLQTSEGLGSIQTALQKQSRRLDKIRHLIRSLITGGQLTQLVSFVNKLQEADSLQNMEKRNTTWILAALAFPGIDARQKQVETAAVSTFEWCVTQDSVPLGHPGLKVSFKNWLRTGNGVYHITGKPGSGKSTLVKFIETADKTQQQLKQWAGGAKLIRSSFYAWKAAEANPLQCQFEGLIRTLLYQILTIAPELTRVAFPELWHPNQFTSLNAILQGSSEQRKLNLAREKVLYALKNILQRSTTAKGYRFFLLLDAMDELEETNALLHAGIATIIQSWSSCNTEAVKICISSREEADFMDKRFFQPIERLRLHLVTQNDIRALVTRRLPSSNNKFATGDRHQDLIVRIVEKAEGVFLWVVLVIREIQKRLIEKQSIEELHKAVDLIPGELNEAFVQVLQSIREGYQKEAWAVFTAAVSIGDRPIFDLFHYSMLQDCLSQKPGSIHESLSELKWDAVHRRVKSFVKRFPSLSRGLLELNETENGYNIPSRLVVNSPAARFALVFSHRSVYDFIKDNPNTIADVLHPGIELSGPELIRRAFCHAIDLLPLDGKGDFLADTCNPRFFEFLLRREQPTTTGPYGTLAVDLRSLEASLWSKQKVIPERKAFDLIEAKYLSITPATVCVLFEALWYETDWYVNWALDEYPPWVLDKSFISRAAVWLFAKECWDGNAAESFLRLVSALYRLATEPRLDWSVNDPTIMKFRFFLSTHDAEAVFQNTLGYLQASAWLIIVLSVLQAASGYSRTLGAGDLHYALVKMLEVGAEPRIQFTWWYEKQPSQTAAQSIDKHPGSVAQFERDSHTMRQKPYTMRSHPPLFRHYDKFKMTVQEGNCPEQVIQNSEWEWSAEKNGIISLFINEFGYSGSVSLREILVRVFDASDEKDNDSKKAVFGESKRELFRVLDEALSRTESVKQKAPSNQGASQDATRSGQHTAVATVQEVQAYQSGHDSIHRDDESANSVTFPFLSGKGMEAIWNTNELASVMHDWQAIILGAIVLTLST